MSQFHALARMSLSYILIFSRSRTALFWSLLFPVFLLIGFGYIFGGNDPQRLAYLIPGILTITIISSTFFGTAMTMVSQRELGVLRRYRATPVSALVVVAAHAVLSCVSLSLSFIIQLIVARLVFDLRISGSLLSLIVVAAMSFFAFAPLGLIVGSVAKDMKTAPAITNLLFFPMMFLSGAAFPFFMLPSWLQSIGKMLPATYVVESLVGVIAHGDSLSDLTGPLLVLLATGIVAFALNSLLFRWEMEEPLEIKKLLLSIGGLAAIYLAAAMLIPGLKMAVRPESAGDNATSEETVRVLAGVTVLDGQGGRFENARLLLRGHKIERIDTERSAPVPEGAIVDAFSGAFVIPGLIDSHVHLGGSGGGMASMAEFSPARQIHDLQAYLALGITGIVSLTDNVHDLRALRQAVENGEMRAPHVFYSGPSITAPNGHPAAMFSTVPGLAQLMTRQVTTASEAEKAIDELVSLKVDLVKLVLEEGYPGRPLPRLSEEALRAAVRAAKRHGLKTTCHVNSDKNARLAIDAGVDGLEHIPEDLSSETAHLLAEKGITLTPTLVVFEGYAKTFAGKPLTDTLITNWVDPQVVASLQAENSWLAQARGNQEAVQRMERMSLRAKAAAARAVEAGVTILAGSDAGNPGTFHGPALLRELELLAEAGMPLTDVLAAATSRAADRLGRSDLGRIAPGCRADLVILDDDPTRDVLAYRRIRAVYFNGKRLQRETLLSSSPGSWQPGARQ